MPDLIRLASNDPFGKETSPGQHDLARPEVKVLSGLVTGLEEHAPRDHP